MIRFPADNRAKYGARKTEIDGITFASRREANRYCELKTLERAGKISNLQLQRKYTLIGSQRDAEGKVIERPVTYVADFVYKDANGVTVVERYEITRNPHATVCDKTQTYAFNLRNKG